MNERRQHKRLPVIKDLAEPIELTVLNGSDGATRRVPGVLTNLSAGGMDLVLLDAIEGQPTFRLTMHLPGFDRFEVDGKLAWTRNKGLTSIIGIQFTRIDADHQRHITHMADAYWECEDRIRAPAPILCFHGCTYWDLCEKAVKLSNLRAPAPSRS